MKKKFNKILGLALSVAMLSGCAPSGTDVPNPNPTAAVETTLAPASETDAQETTISQETTASPETTASQAEETSEAPETEPEPIDISEPKAYVQPADKEVSGDVIAVLAQEEYGLLFSHDSGCYSDNFKLNIKSTDGGKIYFTLDGSDPRNSNNLYEYSDDIIIYDNSGDENVMSAVDPDLFDTANGEYDKKTKVSSSKINPPKTEDVDKCMVVRAISVDADGNTQGVVSKTYFVGDIEEHIEGIKKSCEAAGMSLAIVNIDINYDDMFDYETGIYVKGKIFDESLAKNVGNSSWVNPEDFRKYAANYNQRGREWEREVSVTIMESDGYETKTVISQQAGIRIQGNYSRSDLMKGFRLYARKDYGEGKFKYAVFGEDVTGSNGEVIDSFKTLVLRNGGNGAFANKFADTYWQTLFSQMNLSTKNSRPAVVYINGEYWGLYILEEDYSTGYFKDHYDVKASDVVLYKGDAETYSTGYKLDLGELPEGETNEDYYFKELKEFFKTHSGCASEEDYNELCALVDPESVRDYFAAEIWVNNKWDWPGKNWSMWKTATVSEDNPYGDGRWRFCIYDIEFGGVSGKSDATTNTIKEDNYKDKGLLDMNTSNPAVLCFAYMMTNESFRKDFYNKLYSLSEKEVEKTHALEVLDNFNAIYTPLYTQFFNRYKGTGSVKNSESGGYFSVQCIRDFLEKRADYIQKMISWCDKILG